MKIEIPIRAKPFARRETRRYGTKRKPYFDPRQKLKEAIGFYVRNISKSTWPGKSFPLKCRLSVKIIFKPNSIEIEIKEIERRRPKAMVGDIDNFQKLVFDALNGIVWEDDRQIETVVASFEGYEKKKERSDDEL